MKTGAYLADVARAYPDREALVFGETRLTYRELAERASRIATFLRAQGAGIGDRVALLIENSATWVEAYYGIVAAGAIAVPISTRLMQPEIAYVIGDAQPKILICEERHASMFLGVTHGLTVFSPDEIGRVAQATTPAPPMPRLDPMPDDCLIIYTSGTSGDPKGAVATHANFLLIATMHALEWNLTQEDRFLVSTGFAHRVAIARMYDSLVLGATLVVLGRFDIDAALDAFERERITVAGLVPTVARMLLTRIVPNDPRCATLRTMCATGEAFPTAAKQKLFALLPQVRLFSFFAMTEAAGMGTLRPEHQLSHGTSVGRPSLGVDVRIVDDDGRDVTAGEVGEIVVRAGEPGRFFVMRAYYNRPDETAQAFRDGWFRSGDLGRFDADGFLYLVDRKKDMIVSGGFNIYSREVERAIATHPAVADVAIVGRPDEVFGESVVAFVELVPGATATENAIVDHCRELVASYKKPKRVYFLPTLPRNQQGKILKRVLRDQLPGENVPILTAEGS